MKKLILVIALLTVSLFLFAQKIELKAKVDERCELLSTVSRLAEAEGYVPDEFPVFPFFVDSVGKYFEPFKTHKLIEYCKIYYDKYDVGFDAPMSLAIHLQIVDRKISLIPNVQTNSLDSRWNRDSLPHLIELLNDFYTTTNFHDFFQRQTIKEKVETAANEYFKKINLEWYENFFGEVPDGNFNLIISLSNGQYSYGPKVEYLDGKEDLYAITISAIDNLGNPFFDDGWSLELIVHEFCHSFCNHLIVENYPEMKKKADEFYKLNEEILSEQAYGNSQIMLFEILVRASVIKYFADHYPINIEGLFSREINNGFIWIRELYNSFDNYEKNRDKYPTLKSFMPEIVKVQNNLNPHEVAKKR